MADLEQVKLQRASARRWVTRAVTRLNNVLGREDSSKELIEQCLEEVSKRSSLLNSAQENVELFLDPTLIELDIDEAGTYVDTINDVTALARHKLHAMSATESTQPESTTAVRPKQGEINHLLPKIEIPKFSGNFCDWPSFFDRFSALVHQSSLPTISKFTYLQSLLVGDAKQCIDGLSLTSDNYQTAIDILAERFGRRERIIFGHVQELLAIEFKNTRNVQSLWNTFNRIQANVRSLESLGVDGTQYGLVLTPLIVSRLPQDLRLMWARESCQREDDLTFLLSFVRSEIENRERSQSFSIALMEGATPHREQRDQRDRRDHNREHYRGVNKQTTASALAQSSSKDSEPECCFCENRHFSHKCNKLFSFDVDYLTTKIKEHRLCFICLKRGHMAKKCYQSCKKCNMKHNERFCVKVKGKDGSGEEGTENKKIDADQPFDAHVSFCKNKTTEKNTVLQTLKVNIKGVPVIILFDSGSDRSFISSKAVTKIRPQFHGRESLKLSTFDSNRPSQKSERNIYAVDFETIGAEKQTLLLTEIDKICAPMFKPALPDEVLSHFRGLNLSEDIKLGNEITIDILIGQDYFWKLIKGNSCVSSSSGLVAQETIFGPWVLSGSYTSSLNEGCSNISGLSRQFLCLTDIPESDFRKLWDLDYLGCDNGEKSDHKSRAMQKFSQQVKYVDNRYEVGLPWVDTKRCALEPNEGEALNRLDRLERKLSRDASLKAGYDAVFQTMEEVGIIEEVPASGKDTTNPVFYMPHRPVIKDSSLTTKIRPVFDASAVGPNGSSLNDCMDTGPNLLPLLSDILIRFRRNKIALTADIEKAFLQVGVKPEDRDVHRFFLRDGNRLRIMRFTRVPFGNRASPFLLNATISYHLSQYTGSKVIDELSQNMYCDDWLSGGDTEEEVLEMKAEASKIMDEASMKLCKWSSNSEQVTQCNESQRSFVDKSTEIPPVKVLGISWNPKQDVFFFEGILIDPDVLVTKRVILSCIARVFDPLGLISPFIIVLKILFQEVWKLGLTWDEMVPADIRQRFSTWSEDLLSLQEITIPRCFVSLSWSEKQKVECHCFSDSSLKAYGAVVYLKVIESDGSTSVSLVLSKARVSPLKPVTLPRLELLGAVVGAQLIRSVMNTLKLPEGTKYYCWTDSMIVMQWIRSDPVKWKMFVSNRVTQIQELTAPESWHHCPGVKNPADCLTRGLTAREIKHNSLWLQGPSWLKDPVTLSDDNENDNSDLNEEAVEVKVCLARVEPVLDLERWGEFSKAARVTGWILRFINNCRKGVPSNKSPDISPEELEIAKVKLLMHTQGVHFAEELDSLQKGGQVRKNSPLYKMNPFIDERGLLRMKGRLLFSDFSSDEKYPIIVPRSRLATLLVRREHISLKHAGVPQVMASLRGSYWILGLRSVAKRVKRQCVACQRFDSLPSSAPMAPLPRERLIQSHCFNTTGVDYAGPLFTVDFVGQKFYVLLFTCCVLRAIHIELCSSLSVSEFLLAFRRFVARRGMPSKVLSDNAKTFHAAARHLTDLFADKSPRWQFNTPRSPWRGGVWERLIRSVKQSLKKAVGNRNLSKIELETVLYEIESCINSRPLTYVSDDIDCLDVLTPSHFLLGRHGSHGGRCDAPERFVMSGSLARESFSLVGKRLDKFWEVWNKDYIRNLPVVGISKKHCPIKTGSLVLISEDNHPRMAWPLARVVRLLPGRDGVIRTVELKTKRGVVVRPVQRLHVLEFEHDSLAPDVSSEPLHDPLSCQGESTYKDCLPIEKRQVVTSKGRVVKKPARLDL